MHASLEQLCDGIDPATPLWLLIDPLGGEPMVGIDCSQQDVQAQRQYVWERQVVALRLAPQIPVPPDRLPYLVKLRGPGDPLLEATLGMAQREQLGAQSGGLDGDGSATHSIGGWLQSGLPDAELAAALATMCRVNTAAATRATYLRLGDRRVFDLLCHIAGAQRVVSQFGAVASWTYLDPKGQLRRLRASPEPGDWLRLSVPEWRRLARSERLQRTIATCLGAQAAGQLPAVCIDYDTVEQALMAGERAARTWPHRFQCSHDDIIWAALTLGHPALAQRAQVQALMAAPGSAEEPPEPVRYLYADLLALAASASVPLDRQHAGGCS